MKGITDFIEEYEKAGDRSKERLIMINIDKLTWNDILQFFDETENESLKKTIFLSSTFRTDAVNQPYLYIMWEELKKASKMTVNKEIKNATIIFDLLTSKESDLEVRRQLKITLNKLLK